MKISKTFTRKFTRNLVSQVNIAMEPLPNHLATNALNGEVLACVTHRTEHLHLLISGNPHETIQFYNIHSFQFPMVLGQPWLKRPNPHIDWSAGKVVSWSSLCYSSCLQSALALVKRTAPSPSPEPPDLSSIPSTYHNLGEVFNKQRALSLPLHRSYDCAINLIPGAPPPSSFQLVSPRKINHGEIHL